MEDVKGNNADTFDISDADNTDTIDNLISEAASAIDSGDHRAALDGFTKALELSRQLFGEQIELTELEEAISEINQLLGD